MAPTLTSSRADTGKADIARLYYPVCHNPVRAMDRAVERNWVSEVYAGAQETADTQQRSPAHASGAPQRLP